jgi:hypothetical protein
MIDRWDGEDGGWRTNIMEGPHGGGGRPFGEDWRSWGWRMRMGFVLSMLGVAGFFALIIFGTWIVYR